MFSFRIDSMGSAPFLRNNDQFKEFIKILESDCLQKTDSNGFMACALGTVQNIVKSFSEPHIIWTRFDFTLRP